MVRVLSAAAIAVMATGSASATTLFFKNQCGHQLDLWNNHELIPVPPGGSYTRGLPGGNTNLNGMWRHGKSPEATLFEWTMNLGKVWYDLSIIPTNPRENIGPGECSNFEECKRITRGTGFNVAMQAAPRSNIGLAGANCRVLTCMHDGCDGAYLFPKDDRAKMADCPDNTDFDIIFCPGGPGGPTPPPTPPPTTPAPTTPEPTTPAPTVEDRSIDDLTGGGLNDSSAVNESGVLTPTVEVPTKLPETLPAETEAPKEDSTAVGEATPAVEANTQSSGEGSSAVGTLFVVLGVVAAAAAAAFIVVIRRKKAALEAAEDKDSLSLTTPVGTSAL